MIRSALALTVCFLASVAVVDRASASNTAQSTTQAQAPRAATSDAMVVFEDGRLTVAIREARWATVIAAIERQTGIDVRVEGELEGTVTQAFDRVPLEEALRRLFRDIDHVLFYAASPEQPAPRLVGVWMLRGGGLRGSSPPDIASRDDTTEDPSDESVPIALAIASEKVGPAREGLEERLAALAGFAEARNVAALRRAVFDPDEVVQTAALGFLAERAPQDAISFLLVTSKSRQPDDRLEALTLLQRAAFVDEKTIVAALTEGLADSDARVRAYAIQALAERGGPDALSSLREVLRDSDSTVRMMVIAHVSATEPSARLLQEALGDDDESLRLAAESKLADIGARQ
jgi:HEAT repeat protein